MTRTSLLASGLLIVLALGFFAAAGGAKTALAPLLPGVGILVCAGIALKKEAARKHAMHVAMIFALLGIIGGWAPLVMAAGEGGRLNAIIESLVMIIICSLYLGMGVQSFIEARKASQA